VALGLLLVVVYLRAGVSAVVAAFPALLLACCYRVACGLLAVAQIVALAWPYWWPAGAGVVAVAVHAWPLVLACCWPAAAAALSGWWPDEAWIISKALLITALQHGTATLPGGTYRGRPEIFWAEFQF